MHCFCCVVLRLQLSHTLTSELLHQQKTTKNRLVKNSTQIHGISLAVVCLALKVQYIEISCKVLQPFKFTSQSLMLKMQINIIDCIVDEVAVMLPDDLHANHTWCVMVLIALCCITIRATVFQHFCAVANFCHLSVIS